jgi:hypothetical protein
MRRDAGEHVMDYSQCQNFVRITRFALQAWVDGQWDSFWMHHRWLQMWSQASPATVHLFGLVEETYITEAMPLEALDLLLNL